MLSRTVEPLRFDTTQSARQILPDPVPLLPRRGQCQRCRTFLEHQGDDRAVMPIGLPTNFGDPKPERLKKF